MASNVYAKIGTLDGETADATMKNKKFMDVESVSLSAGAAVDPSHPTATDIVTSFSGLSITKAIGPSSPQLFIGCLKKAVMDAVTVIWVNDKGQESYEVSLTGEVRLASVSHSMAPGGGSESLTFVGKKLNIYNKSAKKQDEIDFTQSKSAEVAKKL